MLQSPLFTWYTYIDIHWHKKSLKITNGYSESVYRRRTDNTMAKINYIDIDYYVVCVSVYLFVCLMVANYGRYIIVISKYHLTPGKYHLTPALFELFTYLFLCLFMYLYLCFLRRLYLYLCFLRGLYLYLCFLRGLYLWLCFLRGLYLNLFSFLFDGHYFIHVCSHELVHDFYMLQHDQNILQSIRW